MRIAATLPAADIERAKDWYSRVLQTEPTGQTEDGSYWFDIEQNRTVAVHSGLMLDSMEKIYGADELLREITIKP